MAARHTANSTLADAFRDLRLLAAVARGFVPCAGDGAENRAARAEGRPRPQPRPGRCGAVWGHLVLRTLIASGSFGTVYRAYDPKRRTEVALKLPRIGRPSRARNARLLEEARRLARLTHPGVVELYGAAISGGRAGLWMELVEGQTLEVRLREHGPLHAAEAARIGRDLAAALDAVHAGGIVHGDVKPENVICERAGRVVLIDFGCSRAMIRLQAPRRIAGTPLYLAPEVLAGGAATATSDIYSLGVLLFHLVTGDYPVPAASLATLSEAQQGGHMRRLENLRADLPAAFCETVTRALSFDAAARQQTARELERDLARLSRSSDRTLTNR